MLVVDRCRFMPVLLCNVLPNVTDTSHGAWRRLVSINFPTLFTSERITKPNEKALDPNIDQKIEKWADGLLTYMLTNGYRKANGQPLIIPKSVEKSTRKYRAESDFYQDYYNERIVRTDCPSDRIVWTDMWVDFYHWFRRSHGWEHLPKKVEVRKRFESEIFQKKLVKMEWVGFIMPGKCSAAPQ